MNLVSKGVESQSFRTLQEGKDAEASYYLFDNLPDLDSGQFRYLRKKGPLSKD